MTEFPDLVGKTLAAVDVRRGMSDAYDRIVFACDDGKSYVMWHSQDCCESVDIDDIVGDIDDLIGTPLLTADMVSNSDDPPKKDECGYSSYSHTWTFYKLRTIKGSVDIRWYGGSNGYYSEEVSFAEAHSYHGR